MDARIRLFLKRIIPSKKLFYLALFLLSLGIISGAIFLVVINQNDKLVVIDEINTFISNINTNNFNSLESLKTSLINNSIYLIIIFILSMSIIGILLNIFITYIKGFILGFSITSLIYTHGIKGILSATIYIFPHQLLNIFSILLIFTYSLILTKYIILFFKGKKDINIKLFLKKYFYILLITLFIIIISSLIESFITPALFKLVIKLFI